MLNYSAKLLFVFISCSLLIACHKAPVLDNKLALKIVTANYTSSGYAISIVTNNPNARGEDSRGWNCDDKQAWVDAGVVSCKKAGRSGVYLKFTPVGEKLLIGKPWGDDILRNTRVIAVSQSIQDITSIELVDESHAIVNYSLVYDHYTPFANSQLKATIALNVPQIKQASIILKGDEWLIDK
ncbi:MAG TPA: hypothetical protein EYG50_00245 [Cycloclasticus sp.]|nr:hypothetical protein [Cycloclasticus sp.]HIL91172.1 hypothetical protein [Cycloclasticus sp.]